MVRMVSCCAVGCANRTSKQIPGVSFHRFPSDAALKEKWVIAIRRKNWFPSKYSRVCSIHFAENDIDRSQTRLRLKENVVPTVFKHFPPYYQMEAKRFKQKLQSDRELKGGRTSVLHEGLLQKAEEYSSCIESADRNLSKIDECNPVVNTFQNSPTLFSLYLAVKNMSVKSSPLQYSYRNIKTDYSSITVRDHQDKGNKNLNLVPEKKVSSTKKKLTYENLLGNLSLIKLPSNMWGITPAGKFIICARWSEEYVAEKRVVIENNLIIRVFLKDWEINISDLMDVTCIDDISALLEKVEIYKFSLEGNVPKQASV